MEGMSRWVIAIVLAVLVVLLLVWARGRDHRRGDDVGARASTAAIASSTG